LTLATWITRDVATAVECGYAQVACEAVASSTVVTLGEQA